MHLRVTLGNARKRVVNDLRIQHQQMAPNVAPSSERLAIHYSIRESFFTSVVRTCAGATEAIPNETTKQARSSHLRKRPGLRTPDVEADG